ncbi:MAG: ATP synthase subunit alpha [bacterium ADurb.Bin400]|nr:MAG: ATP synthase subunit alpha [bacterium ADurb.Bin400]
MTSNLEDFLKEALEDNLSAKPVTVSEEAFTKISDVLKKSLPDTTLTPDIVEVGEVIYIGDGICKVAGLTNARIDDVLKVKTDDGEVMVLVLGISDSIVESVVLGDYFTIKKGNLVFSTQKTLKVPAGDKVLGRVISPIGQPLDGLGALKVTQHMDVERPAPAVYMRTPIKQQLKTGFVVIDSIIPIGRGQRELVTGDRKTGKTRLMADIICNLKDQGVICVYVAIGAQKAKVKALAEYLKKSGALDYTTIVMGSSDDPPSLNYLAPYAGTAIAEYFCDQGKDALMIYDDLSKHAKAYRQMSLLLKRSPGRDAYPGDIFYLHSRLLERSAKVSEKYGNGSITALPMCETQNGDISEYITTNLMSITDGHIYLDSQLMHDGILPAVNSSASVSRIGSGIQPPFVKKYGGMAGGQLARYNEVKSYETMNTEITEETEREINRGKRILEIFSQPSGMCYSVFEETILLHLVVNGFLDYIDVKTVAELKKEVVEFYRQHQADYKKLNAISVGETKDEDNQAASLFEEFVHNYIAKSKTDASKALDDQIKKIKEAKEAAAAAKLAAEKEAKESAEAEAPSDKDDDQNTKTKPQKDAKAEESAKSEKADNKEPKNDKETKDGSHK